jgi:hypothetical protein
MHIELFIGSSEGIFKDYAEDIVERKSILIEAK